MNQQANLFIVAVLAFLLTNGCSSCKASSSSENDKVTTAEPETTITYALFDFHGIACSGVVNIIYTQGPSCKVSIKTRSDMVGAVKPKVSNDGILKLSSPSLTDKAKERWINTYREYPPKIVVYVTSPVMNFIEISGCSNFTTHSLNAGHVDMEVSGVSHLTVDTLKANAVNISVSGSSSIKGDFNVKTANAKVQGVSKLISNIEADQLKISNSGSSSTKVQFKGGTVDITNSGVGKVDMAVDCTEFNVNNSGVAYLKVSGTADKTQIEGSGVSKVDTSKLNKY